MIPLMLVVGLAIGAFRHRMSSTVLAGVVAASTLLFGLAIGVADARISTAVGAALLGFANLLFGATIVTSLKTTARLFGPVLKKQPD